LWTRCQQIAIFFEERRKERTQDKSSADGVYLTTHGIAYRSIKAGITDTLRPSGCATFYKTGNMAQIARRGNK